MLRTKLNIIPSYISIYLMLKSKKVVTTNTGRGDTHAIRRITSSVGVQSSYEYSNGVRRRYGLFHNDTIGIYENTLSVGLGASQYQTTFVFIERTSLSG